ncbi:MAG: uracil-DNA glycosylase [Anaerolineales bacterium]|jgi:uracil-DNA glycosylase family 4|nr:uracil-DNA glycosylase [Anaerolineales bacterium]MBK8823928.1 uracil-DNA glycosylase [Anaerolineales bacterium]
MTAEETLAKIAGEVSVCTKCVLHESRKKSVPGDGPANAEIMFIGEGPGFHENEQGHPFVGASGKFLDQLLAQADVTREEVFIANVVKCRPPGNRDPLPDELATCDMYLEAQIKAINPSIIVTLGRISMSKFFSGVKISAVHGQMQKVGERYVIPMFHPAAALHQSALKPTILADFAKLPDQLKEARAALGKPVVEKVKKKVEEIPDDAPKQLNLF